MKRPRPCKTRRDRYTSASGLGSTVGLAPARKPLLFST